MYRAMKAHIGTLTGLAIIAGLVFVERDLFHTYLAQAIGHTFPCSQTLTYRVVSIDPRFGLSTTSVETDLTRAASVWNTALGKQALAEDTSAGVVKVYLVYDSRQARANTLQKIGASVDTAQSNYATLKDQYDTLASQYNTTKNDFLAAQASYESNLAHYNAQVERWNSHGGAPANEYQSLNSQSQALDAQKAQLLAKQNQVNALAGQLNALGTHLNTLGGSINADVAAYNSAGSDDTTFEEGVFTEKPGSMEIRIFEYDNETRLIRVMAHEFGHALGLEHVSDPQSIMYSLNQGSSLTPSAADIEELDTVCRISQ